MKILKKVVWIFIFLYLVIAFLPKENLFYLAEEHLSKQNIILNNEKLRDYFGFFKIEQADVYYDGLNVGNISKTSVFLGLIYNQISINDANFNDSLRNFLPQEVKNITIRGSILFPVRLLISGNGDFGDISGYVDLYNKKLRLSLKPQKDFVGKYPAIAKQFKKDKDEYIYETTYK